MEVYIVEGGFEYEGSRVLGVFAAITAALALADREFLNYDTVTVIHWTVGEPEAADAVVYRKDN